MEKKKFNDIFRNQYTEHNVEPRFSDYGYNGYLQESKYCIFFEYSRFQIAREAGLYQCFYNMDREDEIFFPVIEMECEYLKSVDLNVKLAVRTTLYPPVLPRLDFMQSMLNRETKEVLTTAVVKVAIVTKKRGLLMHLEEEMSKCILTYLDSLNLSDNQTGKGNRGI
ncbi:MAG: hypothetical protein LBQ71_13160 [Hungatella sp.]|jgi:acyl-CoA thioesterase FadM|nr:hypothetical protein [Hungatella sp.]